jgi:hypothetical protein
LLGSTRTVSTAFRSRADWVIECVGAHVNVRPAGGGGTDTLTRVQRARFDDQTVDLDTP